jgi:hypothetical protein
MGVRKASDIPKQVFTKTAEICQKSVRAAQLPDDPELRRIAETGIIASVFSSALGQLRHEGPEMKEI